MKKINAGIILHLFLSFRFRVSGFKFVYPASIIQLHPNSHSSLSRTEFRIVLKAQILSFLLVVMSLLVELLYDF